MENEALKEAFTTLHEKITEEVNPDSAIDKMFAKKIISPEDNKDIWKVPDAKRRCRQLLALLHCSSHPETFIHFREALRNDYPRIVAEVNEQCTLRPARQLQSQPTQSAESKSLVRKYP